MNLKYYLRGLGLGILVTALILTIAGKNRQTMTDAEVKERAKELGMIENTVLVEKTEEVENIPETVGASETEESAEENAEVKEDVLQDESQKKEETQVEEPPQEDTSNVSDDPEKPDNLSQETTEEQQSETVKEAASEAEQQNRTEVVTLTIVSGDTSYSVAKKLFDLGVVPSVDQTDRFLCNNGYDRTIRTGVYTIEQDETLESIARRINGK